MKDNGCKTDVMVGDSKFLLKEIPTRVTILMVSHMEKEFTPGQTARFMTANGKPLYEYAPIISDDVSDTWHESMMEKNQSLTWIKNIYWKLDQLSCVLVLRNKLWFKAAVPQLKEIWTIIEKEKESGYSHRQPKKTQRSKLIGAANIGEDLIVMKSQCYITPTEKKIETKLY